MTRLLAFLCHLGLHADDFNSYGSIPVDVWKCRRCGREIVKDHNQEEYDPYDEIVCP